MRTCVILAALTACKDKGAAPPAAEPKGSQAVAPIDAPAPDAPPPDAPAATRPTEAQALDAGTRWIAAAAGKDPKKLVEASTTPFKLIDEYNHTGERCSGAPDAAGLATAAKCLQNKRLRATFGNEKPDVKASVELPPSDSIIASVDEAWNALVPEAARASHAFVLFTNGHPDYPADVLYALLSVTLVDDKPTVDGVLLVFSSQGD